MATDDQQKNQDAIDNVLEGGQEYQSGRKRVRRAELAALHSERVYLDKKESITDSDATPGGGRFRANFNHLGNSC